MKIGPLIIQEAQFLDAAMKKIVDTLGSTNIARENGPFEDVFPIENGDVPASYVSLPEGTRFFNFNGSRSDFLNVTQGSLKAF